MPRIEPRAAATSVLGSPLSYCFIRKELSCQVFKALTSIVGELTSTQDVIKRKNYHGQIVTGILIRLSPTEGNLNQLNFLY